MKAKVTPLKRENGFNHNSPHFHEAVGLGSNEELLEAGHIGLTEILEKFAQFVSKKSQAVEIVEEYLKREDLTLREKAIGIFACLDVINQDRLEAEAKLYRPEPQLKVVGHS